MKFFKKFLLSIILLTFSITIIVPQNINATEIVQNFALIFNHTNICNQITTTNYNSLSDGLLISGLSRQKQMEFLTIWATELRNQKLSDEQIIQIIKSWATTHNDFFDSSNDTTFINKQSSNKDKLNVEETILKSNKFSIKGFLFRIRDTLKSKIQKIKEKALTPEQIEKNMKSNIKFFPFIQLMLGFELAEAFATIYITGSGYTLTFLSAIVACLGIISFSTSAVTGFITSKVSKRTIVIASLIIHTFGSISLALVPYSTIFLILSQILPTIGVAGLAVSLSPFFYSSMEAIGEEKEIIKEKYTANDSIYSIVMALSSLVGGTLVVLFSYFGTNFEAIGQHIVVILAAVLDVFVTIGAIFKTHKEPIETTIEDDDEETAVFREMKTNEKGFRAVKTYFKKIFSPMKKVAKDKQTVSFVITNILLNSVFFAVTTLMLQPVIKTLTVNNQILELYLAVIYFLAHTLQSVSKKFALKINPILQKPTTRIAFFAGMLLLSIGFMLTSNPLFIITLFIATNFFYGVSSVSETMAIHDILPNKSRTQWLALKTIVAILVTTGVQALSTLLLSANIAENSIITMSCIAVFGLTMLTSFPSKKTLTLSINNILTKFKYDIKNLCKKLILNPLTSILPASFSLSIIPFISNVKKEDKNNFVDDININAIKSLLTCA